jgi:hypothetical protein
VEEIGEINYFYKNILVEYFGGEFWRKVENDNFIKFGGK